MSENRSFPLAADGSPSLPMEAEIWAAGANLEDARFIARQLRIDGYYLVRAEDIQWSDIHAFQDEMRSGQCFMEDAGGFWVRCIMRLFGAGPSEVETYQKAADRLLREVDGRKHQ